MSNTTTYYIIFGPIRPIWDFFFFDFTLSKNSIKRGIFTVVWTVYYEKTKKFYKFLIVYKTAYTYVDNKSNSVEGQSACSVENYWNPFGPDRYVINTHIVYPTE